jgi:hypothetical protein
MSRCADYRAARGRNSMCGSLTLSKRHAEQGPAQRSFERLQENSHCMQSKALG